MAFYDATVSRTNKARDITSAFLTAIEEDRHMLKHKKTIVAEQVYQFDLQTDFILILLVRSP